MGWRKIQKEEIKRSVLVRFINMNDTPFNGGVIIMVREGIAHIARPMAWAHQHFDSRQPLLSCEVIQLDVGSPTAWEMIEVFQGRDGLRAQST